MARTETENEPSLEELREGLAGSIVDAAEGRTTPLDAARERRLS